MNSILQWCKSRAVEILLSTLIVIAMVGLAVGAFVEVKKPDRVESVTMEMRLGLPWVLENHSKDPELIVYHDARLRIVSVSSDARGFLVTVAHGATNETLQMVRRRSIRWIPKDAAWLEESVASLKQKQ